MTSYIQIVMPDGTVYPIKAGGFEGKKEPKTAKYTDAQIKKMSPKTKREIFNTAVRDVKGAYQLFIPANLARQLVIYRTETRERTEPKIIAARGKTYKVKVVKQIKTKNLYYLTSDGTSKKLKIKNITALGKGGAVRVWLDGKPFSKISKSELEKMVRIGCGMVGLSFSTAPIEATFTLARTPRKKKGKRMPTIRGASGEINVKSEKMRRLRVGETKEEVYKVENGTVYVRVDRARIPETEVDESRFYLKELHYTNRQGERVDRPRQLVVKSAYTRKPYWKDAHWRAIGTVY